jgi:hypothetical protein
MLKNITIILILTIIIIFGGFIFFQNQNVEVTPSNNTDIVKKEEKIIEIINIKDKIPEEDIVEIDDYELKKKIVKTKEVDNCLQITSEHYKNRCILEISNILNDRTLCDKVSEEKLKKECIEIKKVNALINSDDINVCYELEIEVYRNSCLNNFYLSFENADACKKLNQQDDKYRCIDAVNNRLAYTFSNHRYCAFIRDENIKKSCEQIVFMKDSDKDGLSDRDERSYGLNIDDKDTDDDGLSDGDEINIHKTNPLNPDTDGDGYLDGDEIKAGHNPNK